MGLSVYFYNCLKEIRQSVYGRDNREPIADSIEELYEFSRGMTHDDGNEYKKRLDEIETGIRNLEEKENSRVVKMGPVLNDDIVDWWEKVIHVIPIPATEYEMNSGGAEGLSTSVIRGEDYLLTDSRSGDAASLISGEDYLMTLGNSSWSETGLNPSSYEEIEYVPHCETYTFTIARANEQ